MSEGKLILQSERLAYCLWLPEHIDDVLDLHGDIRVTEHLSGREETREDAERRMTQWRDDYAAYGWCKFRVLRKSDGAFIGRAGFGLHEGEPEIGYALKHEFWGQGYAAEAAFALRDWIFRATDHADFIGYAFTDNAASVRILRKIGMQFTHTEHDDSGKELSFHKLTKEEWHG